MKRKIETLYGLKWDPFSRDVPVEALKRTKEIESLLWRTEHVLLEDGGFASVVGEPGTGKSAALRMLEQHLLAISSTKVAKKLHGQISRASQHQGSKAKKKQKGLYKRLIRLVAGILDWMPSFCERVLREARRAGITVLELVKLEALAEEIGHYLALGRRVVDQARRRVLLGEQVPNDEKLFSIFEPHTELLKRGRAGKPVEFGHMIYLQQVDGCFITGYGVYEERPVEHELVDDAIEDHRALFGHYPEAFAADKGFWQDAKARELLRLKVPTMSICKKGNRTEAEKEYEHGVLFRLAQRFRAGIEGSISFLKRVFGLGR